VSTTSVGRETPPGIFGETSLVMSGPGRKMYQGLEPKTEGAIFAKRSMPQDANSTPHDTPRQLERTGGICNIQGAKSAKKNHRPAQNPLTIRWMPSFPLSFALVAPLR
jgi:hypothetical protein